MNNSIFSKNETKYLENKEKIKQEYSKNYIYQIRHSIKEKISNFIINDIDLILDFHNKTLNKKLVNEKLIEFLAIKIMEKFPYLILKLLNLEEVRYYLGEI